MATKTTIDPGLKYGFRSGLEEQVAAQLQRAGIPVKYEEEKIGYIKPARAAKYTPDFVIPNGVIVETKGRFMTDDRQKHLLIKDQFPGLDIRFVFSNSKARISKGSKTTYAMWCDKHNYTFADKLIPTAWLNEPPNPTSLEALKQHKVIKK